MQTVKKMALALILVSLFSGQGMANSDKKINWGHITPQERKEIINDILKHSDRIYVEEVKQALAAYEKGDFDLALKHFANAALSDWVDYNGFINHYEGLIYYLKGNFKDSKRFFTYAVKDTKFFAKQYPRLYAEAYGGLGLAHSGLNEKEAAIAAWEKAISLKYDRNPTIFRLLGHYYYDKKLIKKSLWAMEKAIELAPEYADNYADISFPYRDLGMKDKELESLKKFLEITDRPDSDPIVQAVKKDLKALQE